MAVNKTLLVFVIIVFIILLSCWFCRKKLIRNALGIEQNTHTENENRANYPGLVNRNQEQNQQQNQQQEHSVNINLDNNNQEQEQDHNQNSELPPAI